MNDDTTLISIPNHRTSGPGASTPPQSGLQRPGRRDAIIRLAALAVTSSSGLALSGCGDSDDPPVRYDYGVAALDIAMMSCSNYPAGYLHAYSEVARSSAQYALHLGDFIYEYAAGGYASADAKRLGRVSEPAHACRLRICDHEHQRPWHGRGPGDDASIAGR